MDELLKFELQENILFPLEHKSVSFLLSAFLLFLQLFFEFLLQFLVPYFLNFLRPNSNIVDFD